MHLVKSHHAHEDCTRSFALILSLVLLTSSIGCAGLQKGESKDDSDTEEVDLDDPTSRRLKLTSDTIVHDKLLEVYWPMFVGSTWRYQMLDAAGQAQGHKDISLVRFEKGYWTDSEGNKLLRRRDGISDGTRFLLKVPLHVGTTWSSIVNINGEEAYEIRSMSEDVTIGGQTYQDCMWVQGIHHKAYEKKKIVMDWYYAPHVGLVKMVSSSRMGDIEDVLGTMLLESYEHPGLEHTKG